MEEGNSINHMLMLLLQISAKVRDLESFSYYTLFIQVEHPLHKVLENTQMAYLTAVEAEGKEHKRGPPGLHRFMAIVEYIKAAEVKDNLKPIQDAVNQFEADMYSLPLEDVMDKIGLCKLVKAYDVGQKKLLFVGGGIITVAHKTTTIRSAVSRLLTSLGLVRKQGVAPAGFLERELVKQLELAKKMRK